MSSDAICPNGCSGCAGTIATERHRADVLAQEAMRLRTLWSNETARARKLEASLLALINGPVCK
jgi:hypothetical protein